MSLRAQSLAGAALMLSACAAVGPDYAVPEPTAIERIETFPSAQSATTALNTGEPVAAWWRQFGDADLDALIERASEANFDLRIAAANVAAASAALREIDARRVPAIDINGEVEEQRQASALVQQLDPEQRLSTTTSGSFSADLTWEIDLFGRVRRSIEAAAADLGSAEALRRGVMVSVLADVARTYVDLRGAQRRLDVAERNTSVQRQTLELVELLYQDGAATQLDVARANTQLLSSEATIPRLQAAAVVAKNALTTLTAQPLGALDAMLSARQPLPTLPEFTAVGEPADLIRRRPDIQAAERVLAGAAARIGVATADLFPTVSFGGSVGAGAAPMSGFTAPGAAFFSLGPSLTWNLFDRGAIYARIRQADSAAAANLVRYERTVTTALEEVDSAISRYSNERLRFARLLEARESSHEASVLARLRYREGVEDFLTVLDAERNHLEIEDLLALSEIAVMQNLITIYLALGGGGEVSEGPAYTPYTETVAP
jgi:multidrug efflux system outer membrane protein